MIDYSLIASVVVIHLLAVISPGPDFFMALKNAVTYSRKTGVFTAIGFGLGIAVHIFYSLAGLALLISKSIVLFSIIKYLGVGYLLYIGIKSFMSESKDIHYKKEAKEKDITAIKAIGMGFFTNVLNPKASLFFLSLFTLVISPDTNSQTLVIISFLLVFDTMLWFSLVSLFITHKRIRKVYNNYQKVFGKIFGGILIAVGLKIACSS